MKTLIDNAMYRIFCVTIKDSTHFLMKWAGDAIAWYVHTGRASRDWIIAFAKANPKKLLKYMASGEDHSDQAMIIRATAYLKRYCHLEI